MSAKPLLLLLLLVACQPIALTPNRQLAEVASTFKESCVALCAQDTANATLQLQIPAETQLYTTDEAICTLRNNTLFCARCPCDVIPETLLNTTAEQNLTCTLIKSTSLQVNCT